MKITHHLNSINTHLPLMLIGVFCLTLLGVVWNDINSPLDKVVVRGLWHRIDIDELKHSVVYSVEDVPFWRFDAVQLEGELMQQHPWIKHIDIQYGWPRRIDIQLSEHTAVAHWQGMGYISNTREIIEDDKQYKDYLHLPLLHADIAYQQDVLHYYHHISNILFLNQLPLSKIERKPSGAWSIRVNQMEVLLGYKDIIKRVGLFVRVYREALKGKTHRIKRVDARYNHGVAVSWK